MEAAAYSQPLESSSTNVMTLCCHGDPSSVTCRLTLSSLAKLRVMGSLLLIMAVFMVTARPGQGSMEPLPFFTVTMVKIVIIQLFRWGWEYGWEEGHLLSAWLASSNREFYQHYQQRKASPADRSETTSLNTMKDRVTTSRQPEATNTASQL
ncbi:unnamed protein product [Lota lota]